MTVRTRNDVGITTEIDIAASNKSVDLIALLVAVGILALVFRVAMKTRSTMMRAVLLTIAALMIALMIWNLITHGGFHAV